MGDLNSGYAGKQLRIFLDTKQVRSEDLDFGVMRKYLGGVGYGAKLLYGEMEKGINPLGPNNKIIFATGPLTGTKAPGSGSVEICFKSPLTNAWAESRCGGEWGGQLKKAGYDYLIIEGKSLEPILIRIEDGNIEMIPATDLKGKKSSEKIKLVKERLGKESEVATIGPAGENLVRFSAIMIGERAAGRCGAGAVMGAKNLLAIAVRGTGEVKVANPEGFLEAVKKANKTVVNNPMSSSYREHGTIGDIPDCDKTGDWPTKNWRSNSWGKGEELHDYFRENNYVTNKPCYKGCIMPCGRIAKVDAGKWKTPEHEGAEYESISAFTAFVLNDDMDAAVHATYLCNEYGLDTISTGAVIAFAMDCYEEDIISTEDTEGLELNWGNSESIVKLVKKIAQREGIGDILAEGVKRASEKFGKDSNMLAIHGKGLEAPAHDPRSGKALAVTYGTANRGMCHIHPVEGMAYDNYKMDFGLIPFGIPDPKEVDRWDEIGKGKIVKTLQDGGILPDILGTCKMYIYAGLSPDDHAELLSALTGWAITSKELMKIGERVINLQRMFNVREGFSRKDDAIPERMKQIPQFGQFENVQECGISRYNQMLNEYYEARGWDKKSGIPTEDKLRELEIE